MERNIRGMVPIIKRVQREKKKRGMACKEINMTGRAPIME